MYGSNEIIIIVITMLTYIIIGGVLSIIYIYNTISKNEAKYICYTKLSIMTTSILVMWGLFIPMLMILYIFNKFFIEENS